MIIKWQKCPCALAHGLCTLLFIFYFILISSNWNTALSFFFFWFSRAMGALFRFFFFLFFNWTPFFKKVYEYFIQTHFFPFLHFSISNRTKMREIKIFFILSLFHPPTIFYPLTFPHLQTNKPLDIRIIKLRKKMKKKCHFFWHLYPNFKNKKLQTKSPISHVTHINFHTIENPR